jgi:amidohydrolase
LGSQTLKESLANELDTRRDELAKLSHQIHANPELGFEEKKAAGWLTGYLEQNGFSIESGICNLPTAFRASYGRGRPVIAVLAEYDALPEMGHACGHNLIATMAVGTGVAAKEAVETLGGTLMVIGTPAEEMEGGKIIIANRRGFEDLDIAMMVHPGNADIATTQALAAQTLYIEYFGKEAHAAACPEEGRNALEAMILAFNAINSLRQHVKDDVRIHGIITDGGQAANVVPGHSAGNFLVRAAEDAYLDELKLRVLDCFNAAAAATGCRLEYRWDEQRYAALKNNMTLARLFRDNLERMGRQVPMSDPSHALGSSDMGNVSQLVPSIHPFVAIAPAGVSTHSPEFAAAAASDDGIRGMLDGAKAMAMTIVDVLDDPAVMDAIHKEFIG